MGHRRLGRHCTLPMLVALFLCSASDSSYAHEKVTVAFKDWTSPELRHSIETWVLQTFRDLAPRVSVRFSGPRFEEGEIAPVLTVSSRRSSEIQSTALAKLLEPGVSVGGKAVAILNDKYRATADGGSTCLLLLDSPWIRVSTGQPEQARSGLKASEAVFRFPAWLTAATAGYRYAYPKFHELNIVLLQFGPAWTTLAAPVRNRLAESCSGRAASLVFNQSGMNIIPANLEVLEFEQD